MRTGQEDEMKDNDELVQRTLEALGKREVPEGLEARVLAGVERKALAVREARSTVTGAWWRGALSGAAVAMVCMGVVWLVQSRSQMNADTAKQVQPAVMEDRVGVREVPRLDEGASQGRACVGVGNAQASSVVRVPRSEMMRVESVVPTRRIAEQGLTAEERGLVRLARVGDLTQLASLNPEERARQEAREAAEYQRFFAKPVVKVEVGPVSEAVPEQVVEPVSQPTVEPATGGVK